MKAFLVRVNGKRLCKAGIGPNGVLAAIVNWVGGGPRRSRHGHFTFHLGGLDSRTGEHVDYRTPRLRVGDTVGISILEARAVDPEAKRYSANLPQEEMARPSISESPRRRATRGKRAGASKLRLQRTDVPPKKWTRG